MKPQLLKVSNAPAHSFSVRRDTVPYANRWHYHPEIELIYFKKGSGTQFVGDSIRQFQAGDIVLLGPNLPHYWRFDDLYSGREGGQQADVRVVHFSENFWGNVFLQLPENKIIRNLLETATRGVQVVGRQKAVIAAFLEQMLIAEGHERIVLLLRVLGTIALCQGNEVLSSIGFSNNFKEGEDDRINAVCEYTMANFRNRIPLEEIAGVAKISPFSFCRYFKSRTGKTYSQFLIEIKVGHACKLLIENKMNIKQLCYESGFNNFASFHKYFKKITGKSPLAYQKGFMEHNRNAAEDHNKLSA